MKNIIKIAKYIKNDDSYIFDGYDEYIITYLFYKKHQKYIRVVVNGVITKEKINMFDSYTGYKKILLKAISYYKNNPFDKFVTTKKAISIDNVKQKVVCHRDLYKLFLININNYLLPINKEDRRDTLTEFKLY